MAAPSWISEDYSWRMFNSRVVISVSRSTPNSIACSASARASSTAPAKAKTKARLA